MTTQNVGFFGVKQLEGDELKVTQDAVFQKAQAAAEAAQARRTALEAKAAEATTLGERRVILARNAGTAKHRLDDLQRRRARVIAGLEQGDAGALAVEIATERDAYDGFLEAVDQVDRELAALGVASSRYRRVSLGGNL